MKSGFVSRQYPERAALVTESGVTLTYAELHQAIDRLAAVLPERQLLFLVGGNDLPTVLCYLASLARGTVPLLLSNGLDQTQLDRLIATYDPAYVFAANGGEQGQAQAHGTLVHEEGAYGLYRRAEAPRVELHPDLALLMTTSGSTGSPKLVRLSAANLRANAASIVEYLGINEYERAITSLPFNYSYGLSVINSHLLAGASLVLSDRSLMDAVFWRQLNEHRATSFAGVPYSYDILLKLRLGRINMPSVRTLTQAGGRMDPAKLRQVGDIWSNGSDRAHRLSEAGGNRAQGRQHWPRDSGRAPVARERRRPRDRAAWRSGRTRLCGRQCVDGLRATGGRPRAGRSERRHAAHGRSGARGRRWLLLHRRTPSSFSEDPRPAHLARRGRAGRR